MRYGVLLQRPAEDHLPDRHMEVGEGLRASRRFQFDTPVELQEATIITGC